MQFYRGKMFQAKYQGGFLCSPRLLESHEDLRRRHRRGLARRQGRHREDGVVPHRLRGEQPVPRAGLAAAQVPDRFAACAACHGAVGVCTMPDTPSLAGQQSFYAITQLFLFRQGRRINAAMTAMTAMAAGMSDADLRAFSERIIMLPSARGLPRQDAQRVQGRPARRPHLGDERGAGRRRRGRAARPGPPSRPRRALTARRGFVSS